MCVCIESVYTYIYIHSVASVLYRQSHDEGLPLQADR